MQQISLTSDHPLSPFVKNIMLLENDDPSSSTCLPFYADGFPGIIYHNAGKRLCVYPHSKQYPPLFFYGQTIHPIEIRIAGPFQLIIFQLYPFVPRTLFDIDLASLTDGCKDLQHLFEDVVNAISINSPLDARANLINSRLKELVQKKSRELDTTIKTAVDRILRSKGQQNLKELASELGISSRSLERKFLQYTALKPKQFAKIIQFQSSLTQLSVKDYQKLTDIVYENGYADQSHFIRVFKSFTGRAPSKFLAARK